MVKTIYLHTVLSPEELRTRIAEATRLLSDVEYDAIAIRGNSGAIFGGALSMAVNKPLLLVRKPEISSHSRRGLEGEADATSYVFVDDCIDSGTTKRLVKQAVKREMPGCEYRGTLLYGCYRDDEVKFTPE